MSDTVSDRWLGEVMGMPAFRVEPTDGPDPLRSLPDHIRGQARAFYFAKVDTRRTDLLSHLVSAGFALVDTNVVFELNRVSEMGDGFPGVVVGDLDPLDEAAVLEVAAIAFQYTRFHLDPLIAPEVAARIKREWCRSYTRKRRGDALLVAKLDGQPAGFLAALVTEQRGRSIAVIDLVAVAPAFQRRRVGASLTAAFVQRYRSRAASLRVGTQVANIPSVRLYERAGFSLESSQYVLHLHVEGGRPRV